MAGFFSRIQSKFKQEYGGRYLAFLLDELFTEDPELLTKIFPELKKEHLRGAKINLEYTFMKGRVADLAVRDKSGEPLALAEIKDEDHKNPRNDDQIRDYLRFAKRSGARFVLISKHMPSDKVCRILEHTDNSSVRKKPLRFRDLHEIVSRRETPLGRLFCDYLREKGVTYQMIDVSRSMPYVIRQMAAGNTDGLGRLHSKSNASSVPEMFGTILENADRLGAWFRETVGRKLFNQAFTPDFALHRYYDTEALQKELSRLKRKDRYYEPETTEVDFDIGSIGTLAGAGRLWIGYRFALDCNKRFHTRIHACLHPHGFKDENDDLEQEWPVSTFPSEERARRLLLERVSLCLAAAIEEPKIPVRQKGKFEKLRKRIIEHQRGSSRRESAAKP